jgi:DNA repair protein RadA/Sms
MARNAPGFTCSACAAPALKWAGRCAKCGEFGTVHEVQSTPNSGLRASVTGRPPARPARGVAEALRTGPIPRLPTGIGEFDRVLGGGLVAGQVVLCSGPPGSGKSTLVLAAANALAEQLGRPVLYASGEESVEQVALRASRLQAHDPGLMLADDTDLATVIGQIDALDPALVVIDSVQTIASAEVDGRAGGVAQVMEVAQAITRIAKSRGMPVILIGQVTKDSNVAGPRALEHIVDAHLNLDGDAHTSLRLLRSIKNRFGPLEVAAFEQTDTGMREVVDPSALFRGEREVAVPGVCVTVTVEGNRALMAEVQSLVAPTTSPNPRRGVTGLDSARSTMLIAVTERAAGLKLYDKDVYLATLAGMRLTDPASDLAVCLAVVSAAHDRALPLDATAIGEVALSGDVRGVPMMAERVSEAVRLGYRVLLVPPGSAARVNGRAGSARLIEVPSLSRAIRAAWSTSNDQT